MITAKQMIYINNLDFVLAYNKPTNNQAQHNFYSKYEVILLKGNNIKYLLIENTRLGIYRQLLLNSDF
ncbi:hypothetical protein NIES4102_35070 [Chondrocystis sp. NIES-4102]|nr:hypothetical protein NIES4102_35070 [Chondrocystis sp. NIES-4102]